MKEPKTPTDLESANVSGKGAFDDFADFPGCDIMPIINMIYSKQLVIGLIVVVFFKLGVGTKLETTGGLPRELRLDSSQVEFMYS